MVVETHLDTTAEEERLSLDGYSLHKNNHPQNVKRGGVGLYVKDSLPSKTRLDLVTLPECVVCEIQLSRKKYFFVVIYRSPSQAQSEFDNFMINFEMMLSKMRAENPFCITTTGDFNCRSTQWWENDIENNKGKLFEPIISDIGLHQLISEPTHLIGDSKSCIDLIFTDQPNLITEFCVHPSLHEQCHHQIIYGKLSVSKISVPPYTRRIWRCFVAVVTAVSHFCTGYLLRSCFNFGELPTNLASIQSDCLQYVKHLTSQDLKTATLAPDHRATSQQLLCPPKRCFFPKILYF